MHAVRIIWFVILIGCDCTELFDSNEVIISSVSLDPLVQTGDSSGNTLSVGGGTRLYIRGQGFSESGANSVWLVNNADITSYPQDLTRRIRCSNIDVIHDTAGVDLSTSTQRVVSTNQIICEAPPAPALGSGMTWNDYPRGMYLMVEVIVDDRTKASCGSSFSCRVYFSRGNFILKSVNSFDGDTLRASVSGGNLVNFTIGHSRGVPVSAHMIQRVRMGESTCDTLSLAELGFNQNDTMSNNLLVTCLLSSAIVPGFYNLSVVMKGSNHQGAGYAEPDNAKYADVSGIFQESILDEVYQFQIVPEIVQLSAAEGGLGGGQLLTITGKSFGNATSDVWVDIDDCPCRMVSRSHSKIVCETTLASRASEDYLRRQTTSCMLPTMALKAVDEHPGAPLPFGLATAKSVHNSTYEYVNYNDQEWVHYSINQAFDGRSNAGFRSWRSVLSASPIFPSGGNRSINSTWLQFEFPSVFTITKYAIQPYPVWPCHLIKPDRDPSNWTLWGQQKNGSWMKADERHNIVFSTAGCSRPEMIKFDVLLAPSTLFLSVRLEITAVRTSEEHSSVSTEIDNFYLWSPQACDPLLRDQTMGFRGGRGLHRTSFRSSSTAQCSATGDFSSSLQSTAAIDHVPRVIRTWCAQDVIYAQPDERVLVENADGCVDSEGVQQNGCLASAHGQQNVVHVYEGVFRPHRTGNHVSRSQVNKMILANTDTDPRLTFIFVAFYIWTLSRPSLCPLRKKTGEQICSSRKRAWIGIQPSYYCPYRLLQDGGQLGSTCLLTTHIFQFILSVESLTTSGRTTELDFVLMDFFRLQCERQEIRVVPMVVTRGVSWSSARELQSLLSRITSVMSFIVQSQVTCCLLTTIRPRSTSQSTVLRRDAVGGTAPFFLTSASRHFCCPCPTLSLWITLSF
jgi:hypothetical protein